MIEVSDYDFFDYDYSQYWKSRKYEDLSEKHVLEKIFKTKTGDWFLDIGGSYGRLTPTYYKNYTHPIILDYSLKTLQRNFSIVKKRFPNVELIAANAYHMPFKANTCDAGLMVRVLHHISEPNRYFKELERVMHNDSVYVQEFANKVNFKASLRAILHLNFKFFSKEPYQQPSAKNFEGTTTGQEAIFFNFHPTYVAELLKTDGFNITNKYGCSYLRSGLLKRILGEDIMIKLEYILQSILRNTNISPSTIFETNVQKSSENNGTKADKLKDILICPKCHEDLIFKEDTAYCKGCGTKYIKKDNIWDFRVN